jgi:excinuclease ABC subunit C
VLDSFLAQFCDEHPSARCVLLSPPIVDSSLLEDALSAKLRRNVDVIAPQRGEKRELVDHALNNARQALGRKLAEDASQQRLLAALGEAFGLKGPPRRVEIYDNSHTGGAQAIGAMVVAGPAGFMKAHYRTFNIKSTDITPGDDYGMMREVLTRRFARLGKEAEKDTDPEAFPSTPDLVLIDGGRGQFDVAREVMRESGVEGVALASIAKGPDRNAGRERFFMEGRPAFSLEPRDPVLYFLQRLRDEAHRFAIGTHRARRTTHIGRSAIDEIGGIGPARKRALLHHFGSAKAVARASLADLEAVEGISRTVAKKVYDHFHPGQD